MEAGYHICFLFPSSYYWDSDSQVAGRAFCQNLDSHAALSSPRHNCSSRKRFYIIRNHYHLSLALVVQSFLLRVFAPFSDDLWPLCWQLKSNGNILPQVADYRISTTSQFFCLQSLRGDMPSWCHLSRSDCHCAMKSAATWGLKIQSQHQKYQIVISRWKPTHHFCSKFHS